MSDDLIREMLRPLQIFLLITWNLNNFCLLGISPGFEFQESLSITYVVLDQGEAYYSLVVSYSL